MDHLTGSQIRFKVDEKEIIAVIIGTYIKPSYPESHIKGYAEKSIGYTLCASETYILCMEMKLPKNVFHHVRAQDIIDMPGVSLSIIQGNT